MKQARLIFKNNTPFSLDFDDFYFNSQDGIAESRFTYTEAFEWNEEEQFIIAETGFGIGLNFFLTLKRFNAAHKKPKRLFYVSIEGFYISKEKLKESYERLGIYEEFKEYLDEFLNFYPPCKEGYYRFYFKNVFLDLIFGDISSLQRLDFKADVWFLDGFSPSKNQEMFDEKLFENLVKLCKFNAQILTFSASSFLQKNLKKFGFCFQKSKGFKKREMIRARFQVKSGLTTDKEAYFTRVSQKSNNKKVAIIGSGICAASLAYELSLRDFEVSVFEKNSSLHQGASGNESGILSTLILKHGVALGEFSQLALMEANRFYRKILGIKLKGVYEFAYNQKMQERFLSQKENALFCIDQNKAFISYGGHIFPQELVENLFKLSQAKLYFNHEFSFYTYENDCFRLKFKNAFCDQEFGILIYALGADSKDFLNYEAMNLSKVRGQVTHLKPFLQTKFPLSSKAYICPMKQNLQVIGASYDRLNNNTLPDPRDDELNITNISEFLKNDEKLCIIGSKVGFRSYSSDRFAIVGAAFDESFYKQSYKALLWTKNKAQIPPQNIPNLYVNCAHGSRAFTSSILAARYLSALICDEPLGMFKDYVACIHPARFLIRKLKKGL